MNKEGMIMNKEAMIMMKESARIQGSLGVPSARRVLNVERAVSHINGAVNELSDTAQALHNSLEPLMACDFPNSPETDRDKGASECAEALLSESDRIGRITSLLRRIQERL